MIMKSPITTVLFCAILLFLSCEKEKDIAVTSISIGQSEVVMYVGESVQLTATVLPNNASDKTVIWTSSKQSVATISNTGLVTAIAEGQSTITALAGGVSATCTVVVTNKSAEVVAVVLNKTELTLNVGETETLIATVLPEDATDKSISWTSTDSSIAAVENGVVTAHSIGVATIEARSSSGQSASCLITVQSSKLDIQLTKVLGHSFDPDKKTLTIQLATENVTFPLSGSKDGHYLSLVIPSEDGYLQEGDELNGFRSRYISGYDSYQDVVQTNMGTCLWTVSNGEATPTKITIGDLIIYCDEDAGYVWYFFFDNENYSMSYSSALYELTSPDYDSNPYKTDEEIAAANKQLYDAYFSLAYNLKLTKAMLSDDVKTGGAMRGDNVTLEQINDYTFDASNDLIAGSYNGLYDIVSQSNTIINHIRTNSELAKRCRADALVFRALCYYDLITLWGTPPLIDHVLSPLEPSLTNASQDVLWSFVENDLQEAIASGSLIEKAGKDDKDCDCVTKQFAQALLGKAYLWMASSTNNSGLFSQSAAMFDEVVQSGKYELYRGNYADIQHDKLCVESIFESNRAYDPDNLWDNFSFYYVTIAWRASGGEMDFGTCPLAQGWGFRIPSIRLYNAFRDMEGTDGYRFTQTLCTYDQIKSMWGASLNYRIVSEGLFFRKQMAHQDEMAYYGMVSWANILWMRFAEVLLCGAEAHYLAGNITKAQSYLDVIRERAGLDSVPVSMDAIKKEKRLELCVEGTRFQDLVRWGDAYEALRNQGAEYSTMDPDGTITYYPTGNPSYGFKVGKHERLPFPQAVLNENPSLVQNPGY